MRTRVLSCLVVIFSAACGQTMKLSPELYYIGRGEDASLEVARSRAQARMVEQIQVLVTSALRTSTTETAAGIRETADQSTVSFSSIALREVQEDVEEGQGVYHVTSYVARSVVRSVFEQRRRQIVDMLAAADAEERSADGVDLHRVLGLLYKAWLMAGQYPDTLSYPFHNEAPADVATGIAREMQRVCEGIVLAPSRKIDDEYTTWKYAAAWSGRPVKDLRISFYDGLGESEERVTNGAMQATFLFTDKRERQIHAFAEYRDIDGLDPLLALADSTRGQFAPRMMFAFPLPGDRLPTAAQRTSAVPSALQPIMAKRGDLAFVKNEISRLSRRGDIVAGKKSDFDVSDGLYVVILDDAGVRALLQCSHDKYIDTETGDSVLLPDYNGKRILWVKLQ